jgi:hypothetical protein
MGVFSTSMASRGIDTGGENPDQLRPVARVDIGVHYDHELGVGEPIQVRPHAHHRAPCMDGVLLADRHHRPGGQRLAQVRGPARLLDRGRQLAQLAQRGQRPCGRMRRVAASRPYLPKLSVPFINAAWPGKVQK